MKRDSPLYLGQCAGDKGGTSPLPSLASNAKGEQSCMSPTRFWQGCLCLFTLCFLQMITSFMHRKLILKSRCVSSALISTPTLSVSLALVGAGEANCSAHVCKVRKPHALFSFLPTGFCYSHYCGLVSRLSSSL